MQSFEKFPSSSINLEEYLSFPLDQSLPEKTALLNEINRELTQIKECSLLLEKELKQFPMDSHNLQIKIRET